MKLASVVVLLTCTGCVKSMAVNALGDALAAGGGTYAQDDDPELVRDASAFGLKTIESLLDAEPEHRGLLLAACRCFTQYAYAFLAAEADYVEDDDYPRARHLRLRAKGLYVRAIGYGLRGLEVEHEGIGERLRQDAGRAAKELEEEDLQTAYWLALAWAAAVSLDKDDTDLAADLPVVEALMERVRAVEPGFGDGLVWDFFLVWDGGRPAAGGGSTERAREHLEASLRASGATRIGPLVSYAELVCVRLKDAKCFEEHLNKALAFDVDSAPRNRLANLVARKRAEWLLARRDDLFF